MAFSRFLEEGIVFAQLRVKQSYVDLGADVLVYN